MGDKDHQLTKVHSTTFPSRQKSHLVGFPSSKEWDCDILSAKTPSCCLQSVAHPLLLHPALCYCCPTAVTLSSNMVVNNVNLTHSISWSLLRKRNSTDAWLQHPAAGYLSVVLWCLCRAAIHAKKGGAFVDGFSGQR